MAEIQGKELYFYKQTKYKHADGREEHTRIKLEAADGMWWTAFTKDFGAKAAELDWDFYYTARPDNRCLPALIQTIEELGEEADGPCSNIKIVEIPDGIEWEIDEYDGIESIHEKHRTWS